MVCAGMLQLLAARMGHQADCKMRAAEEQEMVIMEAAAAHGTLEKQISRIECWIKVKSPAIAFCEPNR